MQTNLKLNPYLPVAGVLWHHMVRQGWPWATNWKGWGTIHHHGSVAIEVATPGAGRLIVEHEHPGD